MKSEKRIVTLSILAVVLGIAAIMPIIYTPLVTEPTHFINSFHVVNPVSSADGDYIIPYFDDEIPTYVAVPSTDDIFSYTLMPIKEFYVGDSITIYGRGFDPEHPEHPVILIPVIEFHETYGYNVTVYQWPYLVPVSKSGE